MRFILFCLIVVSLGHGLFPTYAVAAEPVPAPTRPAAPSRAELSAPIRLLQFDDGRYVRQVAPLKEMSRAEVRETLALATRLIVTKIGDLRARGILPRELAVESIASLQASRIELEALLARIQSAGLDAYARDTGISLQDFIPGAFFLGLGLSVDRLPAALKAGLSRFGAGGGGSMTIGVVIVPRYVRIIDKLCDDSNPQAQIRNVVSFDYSFIALPSANVRGADVEVPGSGDDTRLRPTFGLIWGPNLTGAIYSASQVAGLFAGVSASVRWGALRTSIFSRIAPSGLNAKFGVIGSSSGFLPVTFFGAEFGRSVGVGAHVSVAGVIRLSSLWDAVIGAFGLGDVGAMPRLDGIVEAPSRLTVALP